MGEPFVQNPGPGEGRFAGGGGVVGVAVQRLSRHQAQVCQQAPHQRALARVHVAEHHQVKLRLDSACAPDLSTSARPLTLRLSPIG